MCSNRNAPTGMIPLSECRRRSTNEYPWPARSGATPPLIGVGAAGLAVAATGTLLMSSSMRTEPFIMLVRKKGSQGTMKRIGIIGGLGPESTIEYYRLIIASYAERRPDESYPPIIINSIDLKKVLDLVGANELAKLAEYLLSEIQRLAQA